MASAACNRARLAVTASAFALVVAAGPALAQDAAPSQDATSVGDIIVTAQKREQSIQDVPIAVSAFSAENLDAMKIEGGSELMRAVPNVSFSKNNFSMYNFAIRGIGTKAVSAASDPAVAVSFNNSPLIRNRLFEQEYLDVNRVEVLRGPQGTLYGRNATAGVVNMIPNLPSPDFEAMLKAEGGNYGSLRGQGMINLPLGEQFAVRVAGGLTQRDGFDYNSFNDTNINGRDLWSTRLSAAWTPSDRFRANLIWEHFNEDDDRSRTGKQLCANDPGPETVGDAIDFNDAARSHLSQGCRAVSLYDDASYGTPNGGAAAIVFISGVGAGFDEFGNVIPATNVTLDQMNPYFGVTQSRDMRDVATYFDPTYRAKNDVVQLNLEYDLTSNLKFISQTAYSKDDFRSTQDYNRYVSNVIFNNIDGAYNYIGEKIPQTAIVNGYYSDPQLGSSNRMVSLDLSQSNNKQWYQEFRIQSNFSGGFNFNVGANYLDFKTQDDYYVFNNLFSFVSEYFYNNGSPSPGSPTLTTTACDETAIKECIYVDPTSLDNLAGDGHNYFRSKNVVHTRSWALFGEGYWNLSPEVRLTIGLRYTNDEKVSTPYPSQLLLGAEPDGSWGASTGGSISRGYRAMDDIKQNWDAVTGRLVVDWRPREDTLVYASYSRGYKGGGANPPRADINSEVVQYQSLAETFDPEYVDAFEIGTKNSFYDGRVRLNATAFYYDYTDYQVSQIVDRISLNENFDAKSMGLELEAVFRPIPDFRIDANLGFLKTKIGDGEGSIDVMNRTQGNSDWMVVRPWLQVPSNCVAPTKHVETILQSPLAADFGVVALSALCSGSQRWGTFDPNFDSILPFWAFFGFTYDPMTEAPNLGRGFTADLSGNELPNAPRMTANIGAQYTFHIRDWDLTVRGDYYRQSSSYFRVYNTDYDRLKGWDNANLTITMENMGENLVVQAYVKNLFDKAPIVDAFTNSDDSLLTTNVFTLDPRIIGVSLSKRF
ncbi:MAG: TonB-dependent receptor [Brevundimonas sp.]|jgi:outer membrane receptor protein involved in Fe transport|uniref:TonB-dependent receptor n=1 Tax=Brevundimonas sp. TaxID=1871086 RepID=UPI0025B7FF2A|nr:TonB-dependent receptor [Brevundimonas sp.]MCH4269537.1 TonB-dependent receptor [Brevundimonas sp.]